MCGGFEPSVLGEIGQGVSGSSILWCGGGDQRWAQMSWFLWCKLWWCNALFLELFGFKWLGVCWQHAGGWGLCIHIFWGVYGV
jgi:hypothetical protein